MDTASAKSTKILYEERNKLVRTKIHEKEWEQNESGN